MAGRNHLPPNALNLRQLPLARAPSHSTLIDDPRLLRRVAAPAPPPQAHPAVIEEHIAVQHREIQNLFLDNQRLAATHVALKQELVAAQQEIRHLSGAATTVKADRDAQVREFYERSLKFEAEASAIDGLNAELSQVRADVQKLSVDRKELAAKLQTIDEEIVSSRSELRLFPAIKEEIETMHREIQRGR
ncbi:unnamed protein product [Ilex paraguariensis]|uniref:Uncharacterized protein n=1 Tax=Ilex paraguariensis TaxID=185542 RepID=A0ABC8T416_9AQUA